MLAIKIYTKGDQPLGQASLAPVRPLLAGMAAVRHPKRFPSNQLEIITQLDRDRNCVEKKTSAPIDEPPHLLAVTVPNRPIGTQAGLQALVRTLHCIAMGEHHDCRQILKGGGKVVRITL